MNHAVFCVTPRSLANSQDDVPFFVLCRIHMAGSHLSKPIGESSKTVPFFTENCRLQSRQRHVFRPVMRATSIEPQSRRGQHAPCGQRARSKKSCATCGSEKCLTTSSRVAGRRFMPLLYRQVTFESNI